MKNWFSHLIYLTRRRNRYVTIDAKPAADGSKNNPWMIGCMFKNAKAGDYIRISGGPYILNKRH